MEVSETSLKAEVAGNVGANSFVIDDAPLIDVTDNDDVVDLLAINEDEGTKPGKDTTETQPTALIQEEEPLQEDVSGRQSVDEDEKGPNSSAENVIPLKKLKNGWSAFSTFVTAAAVAAREKVVEINNSETVQTAKHKADLALGVAYDKTKPYIDRSYEVSKPYWDKTVEVSAPVWEKAKENVAIIAENIKPAAEAGLKRFTDAAQAVAENAKPAAEEGWKRVSEVAVSAACYTNEYINQVATKVAPPKDDATFTPTTGGGIGGVNIGQQESTNSGVMTV